VLCDSGQFDAGRARGLEFLRAGKRELAVVFFGDIIGIGGFLLLALGELAGFCSRLLLGLAKRQWSCVTPDGLSNG
jgi:hypothetical protein